MPEAVKIKICGLTGFADAWGAARLGADFLGFVFAPSPRRLDPEEAETFWGKLPPGVPRVAVFKDQTAREIGKIIERLPFGYLQFHGKESPAICRSFGLPVIKAVSCRHPRDVRVLELYHEVAEYFLVDLPKGAHGKESLPLEIARAAVQLEKPVFLAGGLNRHNVGELLRQVRPFGVDVARGVEREPGRKDLREVEQFLRLVRESSGAVGGRGER